MDAFAVFITTTNSPQLQKIAEHPDHVISISQVNNVQQIYAPNGDNSPVTLDAQCTLNRSQTDNRSEQYSPALPTIMVAFVVAWQ